MDGAQPLSGASVTHNIEALEKVVISLLRPPLNLTGWPNPWRSWVKARRKSCRGEAADYAKIQDGIAGADRGDFASDEETQLIWKKFPKP